MVELRRLRPWYDWCAAAQSLMAPLAARVRETVEPEVALPVCLALAATEKLVAGLWLEVCDN